MFVLIGIGAFPFRPRSQPPSLLSVGTTYRVIALMTICCKANSLLPLPRVRRCLLPSTSESILTSGVTWKLRPRTKSQTGGCAHWLIPGMSVNDLNYSSIWGSTPGLDEQMSGKAVYKTSLRRINLKPRKDSQPFGWCTGTGDSEIGDTDTAPRRGL